jgi:Holliday junction DNA helicase RuvA
VIGRLEGTLLEKAPESVLLDVGGVGYEVRLPLSTYLELPDPGKQIRMWIHTHVREDQLALYGFARELERRLFRLLLGINGVGPRIALALLSGLAVERLIDAIRREDLATLCAIPGVGSKTAQRILVDLRDRIEALADVERGGREDDVEQPTLSALRNLGYAQAQAEKLVRIARERLGGAPTLEELVREALRAAGR